MAYLWLLVVVLFNCLAICSHSFAEDRAEAGQTARWQDGQVTNLSGLRITLSKPVLIARSQGFLWFPTLVSLANGDLMAIMSNYADEHTNNATSSLSWSVDGGLTWSPIVGAPYGESHLRLPNGDELILPYYLRPAGEGEMSAPYTICPKGEHHVVTKKEGVHVSGWPRPDKSFDPKLGTSGFVFNGQTVMLKDGKHLATLYGYFKGTNRYSLVAAESPDGVNWRIRSIIADQDCKLPGNEGPCESAVCRLKDGRLMVVFRLQPPLPYGQSWSGDEGKTWTEPVAMKGPFSVQPSLAVLGDGIVALSGGRNGLFLWFNVDGLGKDWQPVDVWANHNASLPSESIKGGGNTSSYTEIVARDENHLLYIYDRIPHTWSAIPADSKETNSVWVVQATIERTK